MAKDRYEIDFSDDPVFNTVNGLSNTTFDPSNVRSGYMATEDQILNLYNQVLSNDERLRRCCSKLVIWEAHVQVVRMNTNTIDDTGRLTSGGVVVSPFEDNVRVGFARQGFDYVVTFPLMWNDFTYVYRDAHPNNVCIPVQNPDGELRRWTMVHYRIVEDGKLAVSECETTSNRQSRFWYGDGAPLTTYNYQVSGHRVNEGENWGPFIYNNDNGLITIKDCRRNTNYNIIRYYTQWVLRKCADDSFISDP